MGKTLDIFFTEEKQSISHTLRKFCRACENPKNQFARGAKFCTPCEKFAHPPLLCEIALLCENVLRKPVRNQKGCANQFCNPIRIPTTRAKTNSHLKLYLNPSNTCFHFALPIYSLRKPSSLCGAQASIDFLSIGRPTTNHLKRRPTPLTPFLTWRGLKKAIPTFHYLASRDQEPSFHRIRYLRPPRSQPFHLLMVECHLILLSANIRHGDH